MIVPPASPSGLGAFLASADMARRPAETVLLARRCGLSWAVVLVESVDGRRQRPERVRTVCEALRAAGCELWLYTFPAPPPARSVQAVADHLLECSRVAGVPHLCLDIEPHRGQDWSEREIAELVGAVRGADVAPPITLFTRDEWASMDWATVAPSSPIWLQVYERVRSPSTLRKAIERWPGRHVVPLIGTYLGTSDRLKSDLVHVEPWARRAGALGIWSLASTDGNEADVLRRWGEQALGVGTHHG